MNMIIYINSLPINICSQQYMKQWKLSSFYVLWIIENL
jgi:hypothetical protein